jgi:hypothetical protein
MPQWLFFQQNFVENKMVCDEKSDVEGRTVLVNVCSWDTVFGKGLAAKNAGTKALKLSVYMAKIGDV